MRVEASAACVSAASGRSLLVVRCLAVSLIFASPAVPADGTAAAQPVGFAEDVQPIFDMHCVVCHQYGVEQAGLNLEDGDAYANLVNVKSTQSQLPRVTPGKVQESYLVHKLRGTHGEVGGSGVRMPLSASGGSAMSAEEDELVTRWIEQGALDN